MISPLLNRLISCRAHLAETLGVHPTRLLDSIALTDCGVSAPAERYLLPGGDRLLALAADPGRQREMGFAARKLLLARAGDPAPLIARIRALAGTDAGAGLAQTPLRPDI